jgi:hypothetical protein
MGPRRHHIVGAAASTVTDVQAPYKNMQYIDGYIETMVQ